MTKIILTPEQISILRQATKPVPISAEGVVVGEADPHLTPEFVAELKRRSAACTEWHTSEQVRQGLLALEEAWAKEGPFDSSRAQQIIKQCRTPKADEPMIHENK